MKVGLLRSVAAPFTNLAALSTHLPPTPLPPFGDNKTTHETLALAPYRRHTSPRLLRRSDPADGSGLA